MVSPVVPLVPILNVEPNELIVEVFRVVIVSVPWAVGYVKKCFSLLQELNSLMSLLMYKMTD